MGENSFTPCFFLLRIWGKKCPSYHPCETVSFFGGTDWEVLQNNSPRAPKWFKQEWLRIMENKMAVLNDIAMQCFTSSAHLSFRYRQPLRTHFLSVSWGLLSFSSPFSVISCELFHLKGVRIHCHIRLLCQPFNNVLCVPFRWKETAAGLYTMIIVSLLYLLPLLSEIWFLGTPIFTVPNLTFQNLTLILSYFLPVKKVQGIESWFTWLLLLTRGVRSS